MSHLSTGGPTSAQASASSALVGPSRLSSASNNTYYMSSSPVKARTTSDSYKPKVQRTCGSKPACLVNASVTYCGNNQIYAFGGFDQYTDEVYNHVLRLDLTNLQWALVDNYGDIPGVRMGHTACLWQDDKLLVYGGENEHREYLSDVIIFDLKTAQWTQPEYRGLQPKGRARHAAVVHDDKLFIIGGVTGLDSFILDEICYLDLRTWTWSRSWSFVGRRDHSAWVWGGRLWVFGGIGPDMKRSGELFWLDLKGNPAFKGASENEMQEQRCSSSSQNESHTFSQSPSISNATGHTANSSSIQVRPSNTFNGPRPIVPGTISSVRFHSGPSLPSQAAGTHFHVYSSGALLDFVTLAGTIRPSECNLSALELNGLTWQKLAEGPEIFDPGYRWQYCSVNEDGTKAWLLGCSHDGQNGHQDVFEEYLSDVLTLDLRKYGLLGNDQAPTQMGMGKMPISDQIASSDLSGLGADLASMFDQPASIDTSSDFAVTAEPSSYSTSSTPMPSPPHISNGKEDEGDHAMGSSTPTDYTHTTHTSPPIRVHRLILSARWPHFSRLYAAQMSEFHSRKLHIPEPYPVVRAFLRYLYTDSIARHPMYCPGLAEVAGMLVMANIYDMPRLRLLCVHRLSRELDVESAATVWDRAGVANEDWLKVRASRFVMVHWGRVVRTEGFRRLSREAVVELCECVDVEGRVVGGDELEVVGGLGGGKFGMGGSGRGRGDRSRMSLGANTEEMDESSEDGEGMEVG